MNGYITVLLYLLNTSFHNPRVQCDNNRYNVVTSNDSKICNPAPPPTKALSTLCKESKSYIDQNNNNQTLLTSYLLKVQSNMIGMAWDIRGSVMFRGDYKEGLLISVSRIIGDMYKSICNGISSNVTKKFVDKVMKAWKKDCKEMVLEFRSYYAPLRKAVTKAIKQLTIEELDEDEFYFSTQDQILHGRKKQIRDFYKTHKELPKIMSKHYRLVRNIMDRTRSHYEPNHYDDAAQQMEPNFQKCIHDLPIAFASGCFGNLIDSAIEALEIDAKRLVTESALAYSMFFEPRVMMDEYIKAQWAINDGTADVVTSCDAAETWVLEKHKTEQSRFMIDLFISRERVLKDLTDAKGMVQIEFCNKYQFYLTH